MGFFEELPDYGIVSLFLTQCVVGFETHAKAGDFYMNSTGKHLQKLPSLTATLPVGWRVLEHNNIRNLCVLQHYHCHCQVLQKYESLPIAWRVLRLFGISIKISAIMQKLRNSLQIPTKTMAGFE